MLRNRVFGELAKQLTPSGLNMIALLPVAQLEPRWVKELPEYGSLPRARQTLLLVGNAGPDFWGACQQHNTSLDTEKKQKLSDQRKQSPAQPAANAAAKAHPVDSFALIKTNLALQQLFDSKEFYSLYPTLPGADTADCQISLQALGTLAGWHQPSPLGIGINPEYGLWFAYRTLTLLDWDSAQSIDVPSVFPAVQNTTQNTTQNTIQIRNSVCAECETLDCIKACPAEALTPGGQPDLHSCVDYRIQINSRCANRCLARNACPVRPALRYNADQIDYHYSVSLESIRRWAKSSKQ